MLTCLLRKEIALAATSKCSTLPATFLLVFDRHKSLSSQMPESMQVIKPLQQSSSSVALKIKTINKAMKAYLERAKSHDDFLKVKNAEFEIGRQHLANIMGVEVESMTQDNIDQAIEYLLPSGLYEKKARPMMKPPILLFPKEKAAQFDYSGRPYNPFFYTVKGNFHAARHALVGKFHELDEFEDKMIAKGILYPPKEALLNIGGGEWKSMDELKEMFLEKISEDDYKFFVTTLERLVMHPYSFRIKDEIWKYRNDFMNLGLTTEIPPLLYDENERPYITMSGRRKSSNATVTVRGNGTGKVCINGKDIFFFEQLHDREHMMFPLEFTDLLGRVDVEADVNGVGTKANAGAIRIALSLCLRSFVEPNFVEKMRLAGLLVPDVRVRCRKVYGRKGFHARYTWKKR